MFFSLGIAALIYKNSNRDYDSGSDALTNIQNRIGSFFFITLNFYISIMINSAFRMEEENLVIYKEISSGLYSRSAYFWSKSFSDLIFLMPPVAVQSFLYPMLLHMDQEIEFYARFAEYAILCALVGNSFGLLLGNLVTGGIRVIVNYLPVFFVPFAVLAGFVVNTGSEDLI